MEYTTKEYDAYMKKIKRISNLGWVKHHQQLNKKPNFWSILEYGEERSTQSKSAHETRSSRMIRWLMDPNETHGLGNIFAHKLMQRLGIEYHYSAEKNQLITATAENMDMDIYYKDLSQSMCIAIELKQYAKEGKSTGYDSQLDKYEDLVRKDIEESKPAITPTYIFLTPLKDAPSNEAWHSLGYQEFIDIIDNVYTDKIRDSKAPYIEDTKKIIIDFRDDMQQTLEYLKKDNSFIANNLTKKEKQLTLAIAEDVEHGKQSSHLNRLIEMNTDASLDVKDIVVIMKDYIMAQNHTPNSGVRILMRKLYNYLSSDDDIATDPEAHEKVVTTPTPIKEQLINKYNLSYNKVQLTQQKGQGIFLYHKDKPYRIYLSGDTYGNFPNDGIQLLSIPENTIVSRSKQVNTNQFHVDDAIIRENKVYDKDGEVSLDTLIEQFIIGAVVELDQQQ